MKAIKNVIAAIIILVAAGSSSAMAQSTAEVKIKTSAVCDMCKETIEKALAFEKGVKRSELDVKTKTVTVIYNPSKTNVEAIRNAIAKAGYDADDVPAHKKAYDKLDGCCKKGAVCNDKSGH